MKLVDYKKADVAVQFVPQESAGRTEEKVVGLPAFSGASSAMTPGYFHLNVTVGRFGLYLTAPRRRPRRLTSWRRRSSLCSSSAELGPAASG